MPYIPRDRREALDAHRAEATVPTTPGELNYVLTLEVCAYMSRKFESYDLYNEVIGALEACKLEMYRRAVVPYEDKKISQNGDVYGHD